MPGLEEKLGQLWEDEMVLLRVQRLEADSVRERAKMKVLSLVVVTEIQKEPYLVNMREPQLVVEMVNLMALRLVKKKVPELDFRLVAMSV